MTYKLSFLSFFLFKKCSIMKNLKGPLFIWTLQNIFQNIMIFKKMYPSKQLTSSSIYLNLKIEYECAQFINDYNHKL